jgi:hypothetical protein
MAKRQQKSKAQQKVLHGKRRTRAKMEGSVTLQMDRPSRETPAETGDGHDPEHINPSQAEDDEK